MTKTKLNPHQHGRDGHESRKNHHNHDIKAHQTAKVKSKVEDPMVEDRHGDNDAVDVRAMRDMMPPAPGTKTSGKRDKDDHRGHDKSKRHLYNPSYKASMGHAEHTSPSRLSAQQSMDRPQEVGSPLRWQEMPIPEEKKVEEEEVVIDRAVWIAPGKFKSVKMSPTKTSRPVTADSNRP